MTKRSRPDGEIVENMVAATGIRTVRVMHTSEISVDDWKKMIPWYSRELDQLKVKTWEEKKLGLWYLEMKWPVREPFFNQVGVLPEGEKYNALLWYLADAKRMRDVLPDAFEAFLGYVGDFPTRLLVRSANGIPGSVCIWEDAMQECEVKVVEAKWVPEKFVVLS